MVVAIKELHIAIDEKHQVLEGQVKAVRGAGLVLESHNSQDQVGLLAPEEVDCEVGLPS